MSCLTQYGPILMAADINIHTINLAYKRAHHVLTFFFPSVLQQILVPELQKLFASKNEVNVLKLWPLFVKLLGKVRRSLVKRQKQTRIERCITYLRGETQEGSPHGLFPTPCIYFY